MKEFFKRLISKKEKIKRFSSTITDATKGSSAKRDLDPTIGPLIDELIKGSTISNSQLNKLAQFYFNVADIPNTNYKFNNIFVEDMVFQIEGITTETNEVKDIVSIHLTMREIIYNIDLVVTISVNDFHEFFKPVNPAEVT